MTDREELEELALRTVSPELYYELADNIDSMTNQMLSVIISCNKKELEVEMFDSLSADLMSELEPESEGQNAR